MDRDLRLLADNRSRRICPGVDKRGCASGHPGDHRDLWHSAGEDCVRARIDHGHSHVLRHRHRVASRAPVPSRHDQHVHAGSAHLDGERRRDHRAFRVDPLIAVRRDTLLGGSFKRHDPIRTRQGEVRSCVGDRWINCGNGHEVCLGLQMSQFAEPFTRACRNIAAKLYVVARSGRGVRQVLCDRCVRQPMTGDRLHHLIANPEPARVRNDGSLQPEGDGTLQLREGDEIGQCHIDRIRLRVPTRNGEDNREAIPHMNDFLAGHAPPAAPKGTGNRSRDRPIPAAAWCALQQPVRRRVRDFDLVQHLDRFPRGESVRIDPLGGRSAEPEALMRNRRYMPARWERLRQSDPVRVMQSGDRDRHSDSARIRPRVAARFRKQHAVAREESVERPHGRQFGFSCKRKRLIDRRASFVVGNQAFHHRKADRLTARARHRHACLPQLQRSDQLALGDPLGHPQINGIGRIVGPWHQMGHCIGNRKYGTD